MKTNLYNFDPLKPQFYIVKLGFTVVYFIFLISAQQHSLGEAVLTSTHNQRFEQKYEEYQNFYLKIFIFVVVKVSVYLNRHVFVMTSETYFMIFVLFLNGDVHRAYSIYIFLSQCVLLEYPVKSVTFI